MIPKNSTNVAHLCNYVYKVITDTSFVSSARIGRFGGDKLGIDLTIAEMLYKHTYRNIGSILYLRNVTFGLTISENIFQQSVFTSGAIMVEGMIDTASKYIY